MYTLIQFQHLIHEGFQNTLSDEIMDIISDLTVKVASPSYIRTPTFQSDNHNTKDNTYNSNNNNNHNHNHNLCRRGGRRNGNDYNNNNNNDSNNKVGGIPFKKTEIVKTDGIAKDINEIRSYLNRITDKNYDNLIQKIMDAISEFLEKTSSVDDLNILSESVFTIASTNRFYSELYANLYAELISKYDVLEQVFYDNLKIFIKMFDNIEYVDSVDDYDLFCKINTTNEKRKAFGCFLLNLTRNNMIDKTEYISIVHKLVTMLLQMIKEDGKQNEVNEIAENIAVLYDPIQLAGMKETFDGASIIDVLKHLASSKVKNYPSLSSKTIFKFMDIVGM
tara:strand:+ start:3655 stop:4659 length:1005 start_codon:yes stop_codon:yes gene_type:complete